LTAASDAAAQAAWQAYQKVAGDALTGAGTTQAG
jgi:hypothetical protein